MKKLSILFFILMVCIFFSSCGNDSLLSVDQLEWKFSSIQQKDDGSIIAGGADIQKTYPDAIVMDMDCSFQEKEVTITNLLDGESWTGSYQVIKTGGKQTTIYEITFQDGQKATAVSGITEYADGTQEGTFIISGDEYVINFTADLLEK